MFLWFLGVAPLLVYAVFQSPALDYRMVMLGSVLPLLDALAGGARVLHTLVFSIALLVVVMLVTRRRRLVRRRWLGVAIGTFVHLVLDGTWVTKDVFWWPFFGSSFDGAAVPELDRGGVVVLLELAGLAALAWSYQRFGLADRRARDRFVRTGRIAPG